MSANKDDALVQEAKRLHGQGYAGRVIAEMTGLSQSQVYRLREKHGWSKFGKVGIKSTKTACPPELLARLKTMCDSGMSRADAAMKAGLSYWDLSRLSRAQGWKWRRARRLQKRTAYSCTGCPEQTECNPHAGQCVYEKEIVIDDQPEDRLWSQNGGLEAIKQEYEVVVL